MTTIDDDKSGRKEFVGGEGERGDTRVFWTCILHPGIVWDRIGWGGLVWYGIGRDGGNNPQRVSSSCIQLLLCT